MRLLHWAGHGAAIALLGMSGPCGAEIEHHLKLDLSALLNPDTLFSLTPSTVESMFRREGFSVSPFVLWEDEKSRAMFTKQPYANVEVALTIADGSMDLMGAEIKFTEGRARGLTLVLARAEESALVKLRSKLDVALGCEAGAPVKAMMGWSSERKTQMQLWKGAKGVAIMSFGAGATSILLAPPGSLPPTFAKPLLSQPGQKLEFFVRLDEMLRAPGLWSLTPKDFESRMNVPGFGTQETPFFKWNTVSRDSAMLTRHVFGNTSTDLLLFDDAVNAEEISIEFRNGKAGKLTLSLLTRGNAGADLSASAFDEVFKATGRALSAALGVRPIRAVPAGKNLTKTEGYLWTTPHTLALMEYNAEAPKGQIEFLRLKMMPASGRSELLNLAGLGNNATTRSLSTFAANVKRVALTGDQYIAGVPMIDQGQKGYCVSASCARVFSYLGVPCDQNDIAELVKNDAENGTDPNVMYSALRKIDQQYRVHLKVVKLPRGYGLKGMSNAEVERAQKGDLMKVVQENIGSGVPVLWAVLLPRTPVAVKSGFPGAGPPVFIEDPQMGGGHMRLIIGFNAKSEEIFFTDSWGAGHEFKRMSLKDAQAMTQAVFTMQPNR